MYCWCVLHLSKWFGRFCDQLLNRMFKAFISYMNDAYKSKPENAM